MRDIGLTDSDILHAARCMIEKYGATAELRASRRAEGLWGCSDDAARIWDDIALVIKAIRPSGN
ncbi:MAG: hypothetical protein ACLQJR_24815 [Stellaceae bacterium]